MWYLLCLVPLVLFIPFIGDFIFLPGTSLSDITISHYPNLLFIQESLRSGLGVPLWSNAIFSGYPFIADPLSGLHYPPGWLAFLFPLPLGINLTTALHLVFGASGMCLFLKSEGLHTPAAALSGLAFALLPKLIGHYAAGHLSLLYATCWTPWLFLAEKRWKADPHWKALWSAPGVVLGLITLADPRWTVYSGLMWLVFSIKESVNVQSVFKQTGRFMLNFLLQGLIALMVSAALLLPLMQFTALSTRASMTAADVLDLSLPLSGLINLFFPTSGGNVEWIAYPGAVTLALTLAGLTTKSLRKPAGFWMWLALGAIILALGSGIPGMQFIASLPGLSLLRIPARWLFIASICLVIAACFILDSLLKLELGKRKMNLLALIGVGTGMLIFTLGGSLLAGKLVSELLLATIGLLLATVVIVLFSRSKWSASTFSLLLLGVLLINLLGFGWTQLDGKPAGEMLSQGAEVTSFLKTKPGHFRVYSPSYSLPQQTAALQGIQLADGVDPLQLSAYWSYMLSATGVPSSGYSVTLPDFATGEPSTDNLAIAPDALKLGLLNVCFVIAEYDLSSDGLTLFEQIGSTRIYENCLCQPRAWVDLGFGETRTVEILEYTPNSIILQAEGPGTLVLSEVLYPGWQLLLDGEPVVIQPYQGLLRSVELGAGSHKVQFDFKPGPAYWGAGITCATFVILLMLFILGKIRSKS
ncbi:MAG: YfhO family protein [Anaerolineaceae bacterium]|nr:YfhO family protein [Anaerolineaceae bacterium]